MRCEKVIEYYQNGFEWVKWGFMTKTPQWNFIVRRKLSFLIPSPDSKSFYKTGNFQNLFPILHLLFFTFQHIKKLAIQIRPKNRQRSLQRLPQVPLAMKINFRFHQVAFGSVRNKLSALERAKFAVLSVPKTKICGNPLPESNVSTKKINLNLFQDFNLNLMVSAHNV